VEIPSVEIAVEEILLVELGKISGSNSVCTLFSQTELLRKYFLTREVEVA